MTAKPVTHGQIQAAARVLAAEAQRRLDAHGHISQNEWDDALAATATRIRRERAATDGARKLHEREPTEDELDTMGRAWSARVTGLPATDQPTYADPEDEMYARLAARWGIADPATLRGRS